MGLTLSATTLQFPEDWPCGSPCQTRGRLHSLTLQGLDLTRRFQTKEVLDKHSDVTAELCKGLDTGMPATQSS